MIPYLSHFHNRSSAEIMREKESYYRLEMTFKNMRNDFKKQGGDGKVGLGWGWWVLLMGE